MTDDVHPVPGARVALLILLVTLAGCGGGGSDDATGFGGSFGVATGSIGGTVATWGDDPLVGVDVSVSYQNGETLEDFTAQTNGVGRWLIEDLPVGAYEFGFEALPAGDVTYAPLHYEEIVVSPGSNQFVPVFLPQILGTVEVASDVVGAQEGLTFAALGGLGGDPLPGLSLTLPAETEIVDADGPLDPGETIELQLALVPPEQVPMPFIDEEGEGRTNQLFFSVQPAGVTFVEPGTATPRPLQVTYPNVNGMSPGTQVDLFRFDHDVFDWVSAGTGTVDGLGEVVEPNAGAGLPETGWNGPPGPPPPVTDVHGRLYLDEILPGNEFEQANVVVITNNGFFDLTDDTGAFLIEDVPIIATGAQLMCRAFASFNLAQEIASSGPLVPTFPDSQCDIAFMLQGSGLDEVHPQVDDVEPADEDTGVLLDQPVRIRFSELMNGLTIGPSLSVETTTGVVPGSVELQEVAGPGDDGTVTEAVFLPDAPLPADTVIEVTVGTGAEDLNGNGLVTDEGGDLLPLPFTFSFTTGAAAGADPEVFAIMPQQASVGTDIELVGVNLDQVVGLSIDGNPFVGFVAAAASVTFELPEAELLDVGPGEKALEVDFGPSGSQVVSLTVLPRITSITRTSGLPLSQIEISGNNFDPGGANDAISFNSVAATDVAKADAQAITVSVPSGATSGGLVVHVDPAGDFETAPVFFTVTTPPDLDPPEVLSFSPLGGAVDVSVVTSIEVTLDELVAMDSGLNVTSGPGATPVAGSTVVVPSANGDQSVVEFTASTSLPPLTEITVEDDGIADLAGNPVDPFSFQFTTQEGGSNSPAKEALEAGNLVQAKNLFQQVIDDPTSSDSDVNEASLFNTFIDFSLAFDQEGTGTPASDLHTLLVGFGYPAGGPDLFDFGSFTKAPGIPLGAPDCADFQDYVRDALVPTFETLAAGLTALAPGFSVVTSYQGQPVEIDETDLLATASSVQAKLFGLHTWAALACDNLETDDLIQATDPLQPNLDFLDADPSFGTFGVASHLADAQDALGAAVDLYGQALDSLNLEEADQTTDLIVFSGDTPQEIQQSMLDAEDLRASLLEVKASTLGPQVITLSQGDILLDLNTAFTTLVPRDSHPELVDFWSVNKLAPAPTPLVNGIFDGVTRYTQDQVTAYFDLLTSPGVDGEATLAMIDMEDDDVLDWDVVPVPVSLNDPLGAADLEDDVDDLPGSALDIESIFIADGDSFPVVGPNPDDYFFRIDFDGGTPFDEIEDAWYTFTLESNDERFPLLPDLYGEIWEGHTGDPELWLVETRFFQEIVSTPPGAGEPPLVQVGPGFLEIRIPKDPLIDLAGIPDGSEYVFQFESWGYDPDPGGGFLVDEDECAPVRIKLNLPDP
jgi:hypothetical protein